MDRNEPDFLPDGKQDALAWATSAQDSADWPEADRRWALIRSRYPDEWSGYGGGARALREAERLDEAMALLTAAEAQFPEHPLRLHDLGILAERKQAWPVAEDSWRRFVAVEPRPFWGHTKLANTLREQGRIAEAEAVLIDAQTRLPPEGQRLVAIEHARFAEMRRDWSEALSRWQAVQERFPEDGAGYSGCARVHAQSGNPDEAQNALRAATERFPNAAWPLHDLARVAEANRDWPEAERYWRAALAVESGPWWVHTSLSNMLVAQQRIEDAEAALEAAVAADPNRIELWIHRAKLAQAHKAAEAADGCWADVRTRFPNSSAGYHGHVGLDFQRSNFETAIRNCSAYLKKFPGDFSLNSFYAQLNLIFGKTEESLATVKKLLVNHPNDAALQVLHSETLLRIKQQSSDREAGGEVSSDTGKASDTAQKDDEQSFFMQFEGLGANCEFGLVQRRHGAEPISLLRWSATTPSQLIHALDNKFDGLGDEEFLQIYEGPNYQWDARDARYFSYHSYLGIHEVDKEKAFQIVRKRLIFLKNKLLRDLGENEKIFVYKEWKFRITDEEIMGISRALRRWNDGNKLLAVKLFDKDHEPGSVHKYDDHIVIGYLEVDAPTAFVGHVPFESWYRVCKGAARIFES